MRGRSRSWLVGVVLAAALGCVVAGTGVSAAGSTAKPSAKSASGHSACHKNVPPLIHDGFPEPPLRYSRNGVLNTTLRASVSPVMINHQRVVTMNYDGSFPGPALVVCDGDKLVVHLINDLSQPTNLHTHGFHVSPSGHSDNIFLRINPGSASPTPTTSRVTMHRARTGTTRTSTCSWRDRSSRDWPDRSSSRVASTRCRRCASSRSDGSS